MYTVRSFVIQVPYNPRKVFFFGLGSHRTRLLLADLILGFVNWQCALLPFALVCVVYARLFCISLSDPRQDGQELALYLIIPMAKEMSLTV